MKNSEETTYKAVIPFRLPGLNEYINVNRTNRNQAAQFKREVEASIIPFLRKLPRFEDAITVEFHWIEENKRRDFDNIAFAKKFIFDALQKAGKIKNDSWRYVKSFSDHFEVGEKAKVILIIRGTE